MWGAPRPDPGHGRGVSVLKRISVSEAWRRACGGTLSICGGWPHSGFPRTRWWVLSVGARASRVALQSVAQCAGTSVGLVGLAVLVVFLACHLMRRPPQRGARVLGLIFVPPQLSGLGVRPPPSSLLRDDLRPPRTPFVFATVRPLPGLPLFVVLPRLVVTFAWVWGTLGPSAAKLVPMSATVGPRSTRLRPNSTRSGPRSAVAKFDQSRAHIARFG